jgi:Tol biopolymer transport system component
VAIARQIADALEAAHEQGIIHRDLKPANVKVQADGRVKVLDFGLAKAMDPAGAGASTVTQSPTIVTPAATMMGVILGTAAYMSPEQARGKAVDKRSDIWAFGCVLYEMLTARRAFGGEEVADTLAFVLSREPDWEALPPDTPNSIRRLLRRCVEKDRRRRLADIADARLDLEDFADAPARDAAPATRRSLKRVVIASFAVGGLIAALATAAAMYVLRAPAEARTMQFAMSPPDGWSLASGTRYGGVAAAPLAVSPNGRLMAVLARNAEGRDRLWVRSLDSLVARELPGTDGAIGPFWSPDSEWLGFYANGSIKKIAVRGGVPIPLCDVPSFNSASWGRDGVIIFAFGLGVRGTSPIKRVSASGGVPTDASVVVKTDGSNHLRPAFLPDGRHFFFRVNSGPNAGYYVTALDSTDRTRVLGSDVGNVAFAEGHVLFLRGATLMAQRFDERRLTLQGDPLPVADHIARAGASGVGTFSASNTLLAYQTAAEGGGSRLTWFDRQGKALETVSDRAEYRDLVLSPDGKRALVSLNSSPGPGGRSDIWLVDLARGLKTRFTFDASDHQQAVWFSDGRRVIFESNRNGRRDLYQKDASTLGAEELLFADDFNKVPASISPDGRFLLYWSTAGAANGDLWVLPLSGARKPQLVLGNTSYDERDGRFSPDGRFIAYTSDESGTTEVYVTSFPGPGGKRQISTDGGSSATWSADGNEIFYLDRDERLMVATVDRRDGFTIGDVRPLFAIQRGGQRRVFDVSPDGERILVNTADDQTSLPFTVVVNWTAGLTK